VPTYRAIVDQARRTVTSILATDVLPDPSPATAGHQGDPRPRSVLAAPIVTSARTLGVICLDSRIPSVPFHQDHLELAGSAGAILGLALENARRLEWLETENSRLQEAVGLDHDMIGGSGRMREVYQFVSKVAPADLQRPDPWRERTGKELVARAIHRNSPRAGMPFMAINCAACRRPCSKAIFGHEKGAFTGALRRSRASSNWRTAGPCFWTRSERCRWPARRSCCA